MAQSLAMSAVAIMLIIARTSGSGEVTLINKASEPIARASVTICDQTVELTNLSPGEMTARPYRVTADSHYMVRVKFRSGKALRKELGSVTDGMDVRNAITITDADIEMTGTTVR
jgi:hypothetical protein